MECLTSADGGCLATASSATASSTLDTQIYTFDVLASPTLPTLPIVLMALVMLYELYYLHGTGNLFDVRKSPTSCSPVHSLPPEIRNRYWLFVSRRFPVSMTLLLVGPVWTLSCLAWLGLLDRQVWAGHILQILLLGCSGLPLAVLSHNVLSLIRYLPISQHDWARSMRNPSWWGWLGLKLVFGTPDPWQIIFTATWYASHLWFVWPFRYFFYYRQRIFAGDLDTADVFILNMTMHAALLIGWCFYAHSLALGTSLWVSRRARTVYWIQLTGLFTLGNSLLGCFRVFWFMVSHASVLSLWGQWTVLAFTHLHVATSVSVLNLYYGLQQRENTDGHLRAAFVEHYAFVHSQPKSDANGKASDSPPEGDALVETTKAALVSEAEYVFDGLLDSTTRRFIFHIRPREEKSAEKKKDEEDTNIEDPRRYLQYLLDCLAAETSKRSN